MEKYSETFDSPATLLILISDEANCYDGCVDA